MTETPEEYRARLASYVEGRDPLGLQEAASQTLARLLEGVDDERLRQRPGPGHWSVVEILAHMEQVEALLGRS